MNWYYAQNNQRQGPVSENEFDFLVHQKKILPDTLVWNEGMANWQPLGEVQPEPPPPPPPYAWDAPRVPDPSAAMERNGPAWEDRDSIGGLNAAAMTVREVLGNPYRAFTLMKHMSDWAGPFCFALFMGGLGYYANLIYSIIICRLYPEELRGPALVLTSNYGALFMIISAYFFIPLFVTVVVVVNSVLIHFSLVLLGGARQPFQTTYRVVCYSFGASSALQFIPVLGLFLAPVWNLILMINGIAKMHDISTGKATFALMPIALYTGYFLLLRTGMF